MNALWELRDRPEPRPRLPLSLIQIVDTAIKIADIDGIEAVSMQRVAADLGFTKMSLYRHISTKSELLSLMIDTAVGDPPDLGEFPGTWRERLEELVRGLADTWRQHPWLPTVTVGPRVMGPRETGWVESAMAVLAGTGLTADERLAATFLIFGHVRNTQSMDASGTQPWSAGSEQAELIRSRAELFPELTRALGAPTPALDDNARAFGLSRILDGLTILIERRP